MQGQLRLCEGNGLFSPTTGTHPRFDNVKSSKYRVVPSCFPSSTCTTHKSDESPSIVDPPRMRVSRSSVELLGTPGRGLPVHRPNSKLHQLHPRSSSSSRSHLYPRPPGRPPLTVINRHVSIRHIHTTHHSTPGSRSTALPSEYVAGLGYDASGRDSNARGKYATALESLLAALRKGDVLKLYFCLLDLTRGASEHDPDFCDAVQSISATTFSEIIRCFDPINISNHVDSAPGLTISYGAALLTPLGELINKWGVKILYVQIFNRLRLAQRARRLSLGHRFRPLLNDYAILLRCAGAVSDVQAAKLIWHEMRVDGYGAWNHAHYAEFLKTRYLTERLYANNDLARLRLRPLDMHRSSISLDKNVSRRLRRITANLTHVRPHRFGQNVNDLYFAEPLSRILRKRKPLRRLERKFISRGLIPGDEKLVCAVLKANGRMGRIQDSRHLLRSCWNIQVVKDKESGVFQISGGYDFPPGSARAPTEALLDAVATCFANMGEIDLALRLVDFISRRFDIPVPDSVWSDLLDFARVMQTKAAATEWRTARFFSKIARPEMTIRIWDICTKEPYDFKPGIRDYYNLTKSLIGNHRSLGRPLEALRHIKPLYDEAVREMQDAWHELILTTRQGVPNHAAYHSYRVAQSRKNYLWYCIHYTTTQMLKAVRPGRMDDNNAVRHIPDIIREFGPFMQVEVEYLVATGKVTLHNDSSRLNPVEIIQLVDQPRPLSERPPHVKTKRDRMGVSEDREDEDEPGLASLLPDEERRDEENLLHPAYGGPFGKNTIAEEVGIEDRDEIVGDAELGRHIVDRPLEHSDTFDESGVYKTSQMTGPREADGRDETPPDDSTPHRNNDWDEWRLRIATRRDVLQVVDRPAYLLRPRYSSPRDELALEALRRDGKVFTGYHDDPLKAHFAAHRVFRSTLRDAAVPVDLHKGVSAAKLLEHVLWMRT